MKIEKLICPVITVLIFSFMTISCKNRPAVEARTEMKVSFTSDIESFRQYKYPEWFRDAKFGIWSHWGPQAVPRQGDWYARKMYESDIVDRRTNKPTGKPSREYLYHVEHYGHPSKFGYKDIIPLWKA